MVGRLELAVLAAKDGAMAEGATAATEEAAPHIGTAIMVATAAAFTALAPLPLPTLVSIRTALA
jgi:hypothetical protein